MWYPHLRALFAPEEYTQKLLTTKVFVIQGEQVKGLRI